MESYSGRTTLVWESAETPRKIAHCYGAKAIRAIEETFGSYPITLTKDDLRILRAMEAAGGERPIGDIIRLIETRGAIRMWMEPNS